MKSPQDRAGAARRWRQGTSSPPGLVGVWCPIPGPSTPHTAAWVSVGTETRWRQFHQRQAHRVYSCTSWVCFAGSNLGSPISLLTLLVISKAHFTTSFNDTPCSHLSPGSGGTWSRPLWDLRVFNFSVFLGSVRTFRCVLTLLICSERTFRTQGGIRILGQSSSVGSGFLINMKNCVTFDYMSKVLPFILQLKFIFLFVFWRSILTHQTFSTCRTLSSSSKVERPGSRCHGFEQAFPEVALRVTAAQGERAGGHFQPSRAVKPHKRGVWGRGSSGRFQPVRWWDTRRH